MSENHDVSYENMFFSTCGPFLILLPSLFPITSCLSQLSYDKWKSLINEDKWVTHVKCVENEWGLI